ncbi:aldehyde dehydrogenase (NAD+) [bacterium A37T11]|nr:aldehyde dehydrogenase (NAD+) [bacterium A37T11]
MIVEEEVAPTRGRIAPDVKLYIGDEVLDKGSAGSYGHINPTSGKVDNDIPLGGKAEVDKAVAIAKEAYKSWRKVKPEEKARLLYKLADLVEENKEEFMRRCVLDNGIAISGGAFTVEKTVSWIRYYAGWQGKLSGEVTNSLTDSGEFGYTQLEPYGVVGIIITWNGPLVSLAMKIPAAVLAGNTVVVKPSELTPYSGDLFAQLVKKAGFPAGVINILTGNKEAGESLVAHKDVKLISFTGGPVTAKSILKSAAETFKPTILELGGKSANIIFDDADLDFACSMGTFMSVAAMTGQGCAFPTRMLVQQSIYEKVVERVKTLAESYVVGDPFDPNTTLGPVINKASYDKILGMIERAKKDGARLVTGGGPVGGDLEGGYYIQPTVFADVDPYSELAQVEVFGPVLSIIPFKTEEEAIEIANATEYGLSGYIQTNDINKALRVSEQLITGDVHINNYDLIAEGRPYGGWGYSGIGKEGGKAGIEDFTRVKAVGIKVK